MKKIDKKETERVLRMDNDYLFKSLFRSVEARSMVALILSKITGLDEEVLLNADYIFLMQALKDVQELGILPQLFVAALPQAKGSLSTLGGL